MKKMKSPTIIHTSYRIGQNTYTLHIVYKPIKRIILKINALLEIKLHCPLHCSTEAAMKFLYTQEAWIEKTIDKQATVYKNMHVFACTQYQKIWIQGILYHLERSDNHDVPFQMQNQTIYYPAAFKNHELAVETIREVLYPVIRQEFNQIYEHFQIKEKNQPTLILKHMKSKWGVCYFNRNKITLNKKLVHVPIECLRYVIIHELLHLRYPNHGKNFYKNLKQILPNYAIFENLIKNYNFLLIK